MKKSCIQILVECTRMHVLSTWLCCLQAKKNTKNYQCVETALVSCRKYNSLKMQKFINSRTIFRFQMLAASVSFLVVLIQFELSNKQIQSLSTANDFET